MPTFGNTNDLAEHQQAAIDSAQVGYEAFLQSLNPSDRATVEARDRAQVEEQEAQLDAKSLEATQLQADATPEARDEAERLDVSLLEITGTGDRGRILVSDVREFAGLDHGPKEESPNQGGNH